VQDEVLARQRDIAAGRLHPFAGPVVDNTGRTVVPAGQVMQDPQILGMDFLVAGVQGRAGQ
jgi:simple sugar transport system substrate-binding protein